MENTAKQFLKRYQTALRYKRRLDQLAYEQYTESMARAQGIHGQMGMKVQSTARGDAMERAVAHAVDRQRVNLERIEQARLSCDQTLCEILDVLDAVSDYALRDVLFVRYIKGFSFTRIAKQAHVSVQTVYRLHGRALQAVEEILRTRKS